MDEKLDPLNESSDSEYLSQDSGDENLTCSPQSKLQFRSVVLKACWKDEIGMAEIINHKGNLLKSIGIIRNARIYLSIEETLFLVQIGALLLVDDENTAIPLSEIYPKLGQDKTGCSWLGFKVYQHLKSMGYIVGRLGIPWSLKSMRPVEDNSMSDITSKFSVAKTSITESLKILKLAEVNTLSQKLTLETSKFIVHVPVYEVFLLNSKFKKTCPGDPDFIVYVASGQPPSLSDIEELERQSNGIPLKIGHVDDGRVSLFSFDKVELSVLL